MPKVTHTGENYGNSGSVRGSDYITVADRAAGLNDSRYPGFYRRLDPVGERKDRVRGEHRADSGRLWQSGRLADLRRPGGGYPDGVNTVHLASADPDCRPGASENDRVGLDMLHRLVRKEQIDDLGLGWRTAGHRSKRFAPDAEPVALLHQDAARNRTEALIRCCRVLSSSGRQQSPRGISREEC